MAELRRWPTHRSTIPKAAVLAPETLVGARIVASPDAVDRCVGGLADDVTALRFAPDEVLLVGVHTVNTASVDDPSAIIELDTGYSVFRFSPPEFARLVERHVEFELPHTRPALAQGRVLGVPVKLWLTDQQCWVVCATAYAHELAERIR
jgi:hypothetical protein